MKRLLLFLVIVSAYAAPAATHASGISVSPPVQQYTYAQNMGEITVKVQNDTTEKATLGITFQDIGDQSASGGVTLLSTAEVDQSHALAPWLSATPKSVTLIPGESQVIQISISQTPELVTGSHAAAILISPTTPSEKGNVSVQTVVGSVILLNVPDTTPASLALDSVAIPKFHSGLASFVSITLSNPSQQYITPRGLVQVKNPLGKIVAVGTLNTDSRILSPGVRTRYSVSIAKAHAAASIPGIYQTTVQYRPDTIADFTNYTQKDLYIPAWVFGVLSALAAALLGGLLLTRTKLRR